MTMALFSTTHSTSHNPSLLHHTQPLTTQTSLAEIVQLPYADLASALSYRDLVQVGQEGEVSLL